MKKIVYFLILSLVTTSLTGCVGANSSEISKITPMTIEEVAGKRLVSTTLDERANEIYKLVTDRIVVDNTRLLEVEVADKTAITNLFSRINKNLTGEINDSLSEEFSNYLLLEFAKTPYEWQQSSMDIVGFDPAARLYFVDVTYTTTNETKRIVPDSKIPNGAPLSDKLKQQRYMQYINLMNSQFSGDYEKYSQELINFETAWGPISLIFQEQQGTSLYERTKLLGNTTGGIGKLTYTGLVNDSKLALGATMTVRYVLKYRLNLGEETDLMVQSLYLKGFEIKNIDTILQSYTLQDGTTTEVLNPFIDKLILSYHKAVEESNFVGLYGLFEDFSTLDKYYQEIRDYTYTSIGGYTYKVLSRNGKNVVVEVNRVNKIRAKGSEMSLPAYDEKVIFNLVLGNDDKIRIKNIYTVKSTLIGEPLSVIKNVSGISDIIQYNDTSFTQSNREKVESLLKSFSKVVSENSIDSQEFIDVVDLGVSQTTLNRIVDTIVSIKPTKKAMYIINWDTQTNVYASVTVREIFESSSGNYDTEAVIDMVNRNGDWKVVNYLRTMNIKTGKSILSDDKAFVIDTVQ